MQRLTRFAPWVSGVGATLVALLVSGPVFAWGDEGHEIVGLIADRYLEPAVRAKVRALLHADASGLTADTGIAAEATWADRFRDSDRGTAGVRYLQTREWHFVNLEISHPRLGSACFQHPPLPAGMRASAGPPNNCLVDKIEQFRKELADPGTPTAERRLALQFLLHLVGDLHQPLHMSDDHDGGGNAKRVHAATIPASNLHHYWDTEFVQRLGTHPVQVANTLASGISASQRASWSHGTLSEWAMQSYQVAKVRAYGKLPAPNTDGSFTLPAAYLSDATRSVRLQLRRAGVRLAALLNATLR